MENVVVIARGVPGAGKTSTLLKLLGALASIGIAIIHSTDDYFYVDGQYRFDPTRLAQYHNLNFQAFCQSLSEGIPIVVCDNTNVQEWQYRRYVEAAQEAGYRVVFLVMPHPDPVVAAKRNKHNVPLRVIEEMIKKWEP